MSNGAQIYFGTVSHKRLRPRQHSLSYQVFSFLLDVDHLARLSRRSWLFGYNRWSLFSIFDSDYGRRDGQSIAQHARHVLQQAGLDDAGSTIKLLTYPRVLGYAFNPLSVYYCMDRHGQLRAVIYEVTNTFKQRRCYVLAAGTAVNGTFAHSCAKQMYVSPFAPNQGRYGFRITEPGATLVVGVQLRDGGGALIKTCFRATAGGFSQRSLLRAAVCYPGLTLKVMAGIHIEALRLWLKGLPLTRRPAAPYFAVSTGSTSNRHSASQQP